MALKGLDIFKLSPKKNCKECGCPTCMAFCMKVAQGALPLDKCPYFDPDAVAKLSEATAPPMKTLEVGTGANAHKLGGEFHIPHGRANAILLPYVIKYNATKPTKFASFPKYKEYVADERYAKIARRVGLCSADTPISETAL